MRDDSTRPTHDRCTLRFPSWCTILVCGTYEILEFNFSIEIFNQNFSNEETRDLFYDSYACSLELNFRIDILYHICRARLLYVSIAVNTTVFIIILRNEIITYRYREYDKIRNALYQLGVDNISCIIWKYLLTVRFSLGGISLQKGI